VSSSIAGRIRETESHFIVGQRLCEAAEVHDQESQFGVVQPRLIKYTNMSTRSEVFYIAHLSSDALPFGDFGCQVLGNWRRNIVEERR
jgi:hypothetical protein